MDWDKLRVFHAVAEAGSFTHAGDTLNLSQSAVSRQISRYLLRPPAKSGKLRGFPAMLAPVYQVLALAIRVWLAMALRSAM